MEDGLLVRLKHKALSNQLAIAIGSSSSTSELSIPSLAKDIIESFKIDFQVNDRLEFFQTWNEFVTKAETVVARPKLIRFVSDRVKRSSPTSRHERLAAIPVSNFIDATFDRSLQKSLIAAGRTPIIHDWSHGQLMGGWKQSNPENPNLFFMLPSVDEESSFFGIYEPTGWWQQNKIQIENIREMLAGKDLVLVDIYPHEAEGIFHLNQLDTAASKIVNFTESCRGYDHYWTQRGVGMRYAKPEILIEELLPFKHGKYGPLDNFTGANLVDIGRLKPYDIFISYFSGDEGFVTKLANDLQLRGVTIWRDTNEIDVGESISSKIEEGLFQSYSFMIVLTPEALERPWVREELRAAYALRLAGEFRILPVLHRECIAPPFLADYKYADFRDERRYHEQLELLDRSIKNAVGIARGKR